MKPKWLIEEQAFPEDTQPIYSALEELGIEYKRINGRLTILTDKSEPDEYFGPEECVIFYGSLELAKRLRKAASWIPGVYYNVKAFECTSYYPVFGNHLLNSNYMMLPYGELLRQKEFLYEKLGQDRAIFIRPNDGGKVFTGRLVYKENYEKDVKLLGFYDVPSDELCIVAEPINIQSEWRFVVVDEEVVAGSLYKENNIVGSDANYPKEAFNLASEMAKLYSPDRAWCVDICSTKSGEYKVVEIGCFSCAGLYKCDRTSVVRAVSEAAMDEWVEYDQN